MYWRQNNGYWILKRTIPENDVGKKSKLMGSYWKTVPMANPMLENTGVMSELKFSKLPYVRFGHNLC